MAYYRAVAHADAAAASSPERIGVLLVNLGTPDSTSYFAVQRYLREFLGDRRVINTSPLIWLPLLYGAVLQARVGGEIRVELGMTYGNPSIARALESLSGQNVRKLLVLPLYPQYC